MQVLRPAVLTLKKRLPDSAFARLVNLAGAVSPGPRRLHVEGQGTQWRVNAGDGEITILSPKRATLYRKGLQRRLKELFARYSHPPQVEIRPGDVVLDIGSNIGEFALAAAAAGARVLAFEPDPVAAACLRVNAAPAGDRIVVHERLLWCREEELQFTMAYDNADSTVFSVDADKDRGKVTIRAATLDAVLAQAGETRIDFMKLDAEGAEPEVLAGAKETLGRVRAVAVDARAERMGQSTQAEVDQALRAHGFQTTVSADLMVYGWR